MTAWRFDAALRSWILICSSGLVIYERYGFQAVVQVSRRLFLPMKTVAKLLES